MIQEDDRGVIAVITALSLTALCIVGALVLDLGNKTAAHRAAQDSADAAALAVATDCAKGLACASTPTAPYLLGGVSLDGAVSITSTSVTVRTQKTVSYGLSRVFGRSSGTGHGQATAKWGIINSATTAPVVISQCTFDLATANGTVFPSAEQIIPLGSGGPTCPGRPPGAFGWLDTGLSGPCSISTTLNSSGQLVVHGNSGNGSVNPWGCITQVGVNGTLLLPIYGASCRNPSPCVQGQDDGTGDNNYYLILGFAEIQVTAWNLQHGSPGTAGSPTPSCPGPGSASCIRGRFIRYATQAGGTGTGTNFGAVNVFLSS
jgi:Flp pilus assembly protein TadG